MVIFEAFDCAERALRVRTKRVGHQTAFLLDIETDHGTETAALSADEVLSLGRALVLHSTAVA